ncbi:hypothetical protein KC19_3G016400 [Ceratodon purpureus]|uniref:Uncharacterized protein n=1 Tax=Ceratodon purpureus TaxID=3225 RepID=A0A8T0IG75_CERPU|nr:hypothetical protein KC19_3G016400 [Ceratodon purpureus]
MVRFAKELRSRLVPEWEEKYCNYAELKSDLKRIQKHRTMGATYTRSGKSLGLLRSCATFHEPAGRVVALTKTLTRTLSRSFSHARSPRARPDYMPSFSAKSGQQDAIVVNKIRTEDGDTYVTELHEPLCRSPQDRTFFARLDAQLTKVNKFYKEKEVENLARAGDLENQMLELINAQEAIARQDLRIYNSSLDYLESDPGAHMSGDHLQSPKELSGELPLIREEMGRSGSLLMREGKHGDAVDEDDVIRKYNEQHHGSNASGNVIKLRSALESIPEPADDEVEVIEPVKGPHDIESCKIYSQKELDQAKKKLDIAFVDFYRRLTFISSYRSVNITAFAKITKKYDEVTGWHLAPIYMKEVESSYFVISKKIHKLTIKVEDMYTKHFADGQRKKAMRHLRPIRRQGSHWTTYFIGLFTGCSIALFISFFFLVANPLALPRGGGKAYLDTVFPVFSTLIVVAVHLYMYALDVYAWQRHRINYPFIFGFSPGTELRHRQVLLVSTGFTTFLLGGMNIHIAMTILTHPGPAPPGAAPSPITSRTSAHTDFIPLILVLTTVVVTLLPINVIYRSSRYFIVNTFRKLACAPFYKVTLPDFFLGDQLTSQLLVFRNLEFIICYYFSGYFLTQDDASCKRNSTYQGFGYLMVLIPYWWRFLQCLRRYFEENDRVQLEGAMRLVAVFTAVALRQAYGNNRHRPRYELLLRVLFIIASTIATSISNYWDICHDWSLLNPKSKNKWLRDKLILKHKSIYWIAMGVNTVLRVAWMSSLLQIQVSTGFNQNAFDVIVAALEVLRRGIWNFFRIENEHLTNVGKYRAEVAVPLPFDHAE